MINAYIQAEEIPENWVLPQQLEGIKGIIEDKIDEGKAISSLVDDLSKVYEYELLIEYLRLYRILDDVSKKNLLNEQSNWNDKRTKLVKKVRDEGEGQLAYLDERSEFIEVTKLRIKALKRKYKQTKLSLPKNKLQSTPLDEE